MKTTFQAISQQTEKHHKSDELASKVWNQIIQYETDDNVLFFHFSQLRNHESPLG